MIKRILHMFVAMNPGGAETMVMNLYRQVNRSEVQFDFLLNSVEQGFYEEEIQRLGGRIYKIKYPTSRNLLSYKKQLFLILKENNISAIHSHAHYFSGIVLEVAKKAGVPVRIAHSHTTSDGRKTTFLRNLYRSYCKNKILSNATHLFGCSKGACQALFGSKDKRSIVLKNSFNLTDYEKIKGFSKRETRDLVRLPHDKIIIGHIGRFDKVKNHSLVINSFYQFHQRNPQAHLVLVGEGPEKEEMVKLIEELKLTAAVSFLGNRRDVPTVLSSLDVFIFPSFYEGLGNVIIEAQAAGIPCLVSDTIPREVDLDLNLVSFKSIEDGPISWAEKMDNLFHNEEKKDWLLLEKHLKDHGYDSIKNAKLVQRIYVGG